MSFAGLTAMDLRALKGVRQISCVQVAREAEAIAASEAGMDMIGTAFTPAQYLFSADLLSENTGHIPRHAKVYRYFAAERERLQRERVAAYREYIADVGFGAFPEAGHVVGMDDDVLNPFLDRADGTG